MDQNEQWQIHREYYEGWEYTSDEDEDHIGDTELKPAGQHELSGNDQHDRADAEDWKEPGITPQY
ncbi:MAG: hypothetical protein ACHQT6_04670 [Candidatus Acidiferrales bacterium]